ncbi:MAG: T9SS type A sorting domain-containing protein [Phycisphaerae bacterium]|nr:T9SS type A sorting domain-containing protein [Saprospiraceae bacterium]
MKNISFLPFILLLLLVTTASAQTAKGGCTTATVTANPPYSQNLYFSYVSWGDCGSVEEPCCRVIFSGSPVAPRYYLERKNSNGTWTQVAGPQASPVLSDPGVLNPHGVYRVRINVPVPDYNVCEGGEPLRCYNPNGQFVGYWGKWGPNEYTNEVLLGKTVASDNSYFFVDGGGGDANPFAFDYLEIAQINTSACKNYDQWWVAIIEQGGQSRYASNGWEFSPVGNGGIFNLTNLWKDGHSNWEFDPLMTYTVQFVVENHACLNGQGWNVNNQNYFICPFGSGCRFDEGVGLEAAISPNPTSNTLRLTNFTPTAAQEYQLTITDLSGRTVKSVQSWVNEDMDVSDLPQGMYILNLTSNGTPLFSDQFIVNH